MATMPVDARDLFDNHMLAAITANPKRACEVKASFVFLVEGAGNWFFDLTKDVPVTASGDIPADDLAAAQVTVKISNADFKIFLATPEKGMEFYLNGKLKITGKPQVAAKLQQFMALVAP